MRLTLTTLFQQNWGGKDDPSNFALTHSSCNRSKQASNLEIAKILNHFSNIRKRVSEENRGPNLDDVFYEYNGSKWDIKFKNENGTIEYSLPEIGENDIFQAPVYVDDLSGFEYFFTKLPIE